MPVSRIEDHRSRNSDADRATLSALFKGRRERDLARDLGLRPGDLFEERHQAFCRAMFTLDEEGVPVDLVTVIEWIRKRGLDHDGNAAAELAQIEDETSTSAGLSYWIDIVKENAVRRRGFRLLEEAHQGLSRGNPEEVLRDLRDRVEEVTNADESRGGRVKPLSIEETTAGQFLDQEPPTQEFVFEDLIMKGVVGALIGLGGSSKGFLLLSIALIAAIGETVFKGFSPTGDFRVLALFGEDPIEVVHDRFHHILKRFFPNLPREIRVRIERNLHLASVVGKIGPLMQLDGGNPVRSPWFDWLRRSIENLGGVDLLILDPKSRFYGLEENDNAHNTAWISCLEELSQHFGATTLFSHHANKHSAGALDQGSARGGSALVDGCRWVANVRQFDEKTAKKYRVDNPRDFIEFDVTKTNYSPSFPRTFHFKRSGHGVLVPVNLGLGRVRDKARELCRILTDHEQEGIQFSRRDLRESTGKEIRKKLEMTTRETMEAVDFALREGWLKSVTASGFGKGRREVLEATIEG